MSEKWQNSLQRWLTLCEQVEGRRFEHYIFKFCVKLRELEKKETYDDAIHVST